jgi:hypothetical protein
LLASFPVGYIIRGAPADRQENLFRLPCYLPAADRRKHAPEKLGDVKMADNQLVKKLQIKPGNRVAVLNAPEGFIKSLGTLPEGAKLSDKLTGSSDVVQVFVKDSADLSRYAKKAISGTKQDGLLWFCYPKGSSKVKTDLNRDVIWKLVKESGWLGVSLISIDSVWSAMRFRPAEKVGK